jgi:hypothetical protein
MPPASRHERDAPAPPIGTASTAATLGMRAAQKVLVLDAYGLTLPSAQGLPGGYHDNEILRAGTACPADDMYELAVQFAERDSGGERVLDG